MDVEREPTVRELAAQVAELRRCRRRDRVVLSLFALALLAGVGAVTDVSAAPTAASLDVRSLTLRDDSGNARAKLSMSEGGPRLVFADAAGHARFVLGESRGDEPIFAMADPKGVVRIWMTIEPFRPSLNMKDANGVVRSSLSVVSASVPSNEGPRWELLDAKAQTRVVLRASGVESGMRVGAGPGPGFGALRWTDEGPQLDLVGVDGKALFRAP